MVVMLGVGFVTPPVQGAVGVVPGRADEARSGSPASSIAPVPWVPPWHSHAPPVVDPLARVEVEYVSPSACETIDLCPRKWAFPKLDRVPKESSAAADLGTATHAQHDRYFSEGTPYDLTSRAGQLALATNSMLPDRETMGLRVEQEIRFQHPALPGAWFGGKIDLNWEQPSGAYGEPKPRRVVLDHKTTGDRKYMKLTRDSLLHHPQAPVYAMMFFVGVGQERIVNDPVQVAFGTKPYKQWISWQCSPVVEPLELRWNYVLTSSQAATPATEKSWHHVSLDEANRSFHDYVLPAARKLLAIVDQANAARSMGHHFGAADVEAKPGQACFAFGGCPFRSRCNIAPIEGVKTMTDAVGNFLGRLGVNAQAGGPGQAWTPPGQQPAPAPAHSAPPPSYGQPAPGWVPPGAAPVYPSTGAAPGYGAQINPPESNVQPRPPAVDPAAAEKARKAEEKRLAKEAKEAEKLAASNAAPAHNPVNPYVMRLSFEAHAVAQIMAALAPAMLPQIMASQISPGNVAELAVAIVSRAVELGVK